MKPNVTITMCAYNHAPFLRKALDRLAAQTYQNFKIVACDDGSSDDTFNILKEYEAGRLSGKLLVLTHPKHANMGIQATRAKCLQYADTEFFMGHASDDFWEVSALEYLMELIGEDSSVDFVYGQVNLVDDYDNNLWCYDGNEVIGRGLKAAERLLISNPIRAPSMLFKNTCLEIISSIPAHICFSDWYQNVLLFLNKKPIHYKKPVVNYRIHTTNISAGRSVEFFLARQVEVASALYGNLQVVSYPELKVALLAFLKSTGNMPVPENDARRELKLALECASDKISNDYILRSVWKYSCNIRCDGDFSFLKILYFWNGVSLLVRLGFSLSSKIIIDSNCRVNALDKIKLAIQFLISSIFCFLIAFKIFFKTYLSIFYIKNYHR